MKKIFNQQISTSASMTIDGTDLCMDMIIPETIVNSASRHIQDEDMEKQGFISKGKEVDI